MDQNDALLKKIEDYVRGKLPETEARAFEQAIAADPELEAAVALQRMELEHFEYLLEEDLRGKMQAWKTAAAPAPPPGKAGWPAWGRWLLLIGLLTAAGWWYFRRSDERAPAQQAPADAPAAPKPNVPVASQENTPPAPGETPNPGEPAPDPGQYLAYSENAYENPDILSPQIRDGAGSGGNASLESARADLKASRAKRAIQTLRAIGPADGPAIYEQAQELLAHAYYRDRQFAAAAALFQKMADQSDLPSLKQEAQWYLLLSLVPDYPKHRKQVDALLAAITDPKYRHPKAAKAAELKAKLSHPAD